jgi:hypothetical protein
MGGFAGILGASRAVTPCFFCPWSLFALSSPVPEVEGDFDDTCWLLIAGLVDCEVNIDRNGKP